MEARCVPLKSLTPQTSAWYAKVMLISIGSSKREPHVHVLLFADKEKTIMQANVYARDFKNLECRFKPLETYYIGSSRVSPISNKWYQFGTIPFQFTLNMTSYIQQVETDLAYRLSDCIEVTPVWDIDSCPEKEDSSFNIICSFIHMLPTREVGTQGTTVREFVVLNQECRPMLITFWDSYTSPDLTELINLIHTHPVVLLVGVTLGSFHGTCLQTHNHTKLIVDPVMAEATSLKTWLVDNRSYIDRVVDEHLYEKENQEIRKPPDSSIWKISRILNLQRSVKNCWVKACVSILNSNQRFYESVCSKCGKQSGALLGMDVTCNYCFHVDSASEIKSKMVIHLSDSSGSIDVIIQGKLADKLLGVTAKGLMKSKIDIDELNKGLASRAIYCRLKSFKKSETTIGLELTGFVDGDKLESLHGVHQVSSSAETVESMEICASQTIDNPPNDAMISDVASPCNVSAASSAGGASKSKRKWELAPDVEGKKIKF